MRYPAAEKLEIIRLVEQSTLPVRRTLDKIGEIAQRVGYGEITTFNRAFRRRFGDTPSGLRHLENVGADGLADAILARTASRF